MASYLNYSQSKTFPPATVYGGYLILLYGCYLVLFRPIVGLLIISIGVFVSFSKNGIRIDAQERRYQSYTRIFGFYAGTWKSLNEFNDLTILKKTISTRAHSWSMKTTETSRDEYYEINLLSANHRRKQMVQRFSDKEKAWEEINSLSQALNMEVVNYQPKLSAKTRRRMAR